MRKILAILLAVVMSMSALTALTLSASADVVQAYKGVAWISLSQPGEYNEDAREGTYFVDANNESYLQWCNYVAGFCIKWDSTVSHWVVTGAQGESYGYANALSGIVGAGLDPTVPYAEMVVVMAGRSGGSAIDYVSNKGFSLWGYGNQVKEDWIGQYAYIYNVDLLTGVFAHEGTFGSSDFVSHAYVTVGGDNSNLNAAYISADDVLVQSPSDVMAVNDRSGAWIQVEFGKTNSIEYGSKPGWSEGSVSSVDICWKNAVPSSATKFGLEPDMFAVITPGHKKGDVISLEALEVVGSSEAACVYYMDICGQPTRWDASLCEGDGPYTEPLPVGHYDVALIADNGDGATATIVAVEPLAVTTKQAYKGVAWVSLSQPGAYNEDAREGTYFVDANNESYLQWCNWLAGFCIKWDDTVSHWVVTGAQGESYNYGNSLSSIVGAGLDPTVPYAEMVVVMAGRSGGYNVDYVTNRGFASLWHYGNQVKEDWIGQFAYIYNVDLLTGVFSHEGTFGSSDFVSHAYVTVGGDNSNLDAAYISADDVLVQSPSDVMAINDRSGAWIQVEFGRTNSIEYGSKPGWSEGSVSSVDICWKNAVPSSATQFGLEPDMFAVITPGHAKGDVISLEALEVVGSSEAACVYYMDICGQPTRWDGSLCEGDGPYTEPLPVGNYDVALIADNGDGATATVVAVEPLTVTAPTIKNFVTEAGYTSVKLSWDAFDGAEKYTVQIFDENATEVYMKNIFGTSVKVKGLDFAANYTVAIKAMNGKTRLSPVSAYNFTTKAYSTVEVSAVASTTNVKLVWNAVDGAAKYRVAQKIDGAWVAVKDTYDTAVYVKGLDAGTAYEFAVMPIAADKSRMAASYDDVSIATATVAAATINVTVTKKNDTMAVAKWDAVEGAAKYQIAVNGVIVKVTPLTASWVTGLVEGDVIGVRAVDANNSPLCEYSSYTF